MADSASVATEPGCPCGADQPYARCCGRPAASEQGAREEARRIHLLYRDAQWAAGEDRFIHALTAVRAILEDVPLHYGAIRLALVLPDSARFFGGDPYQEIIARGLAAYPDDRDLQFDAAEAYLNTGRIERAEQLLRALLEEDPRDFRAHVGLGSVARRRHQLDTAEYHFRQAFYQRQFAPGVLNELGGVLSALGRKPEAEHYFRIALAQAPGHIPTLMSWCRMEESRGDLSRAWRLLEMARAGGADNAGIRITEAVLHRRGGDNKRALLALDEVDAERIDAASKAAYGFERCAVLDKMGLHDQAFEWAERANDTKVNELGLRYDAAVHAEAADRLRKAFAPARFKTLVKGSPVADNEERPIFICGFTRSGTSMVEQILSAHSGICGGDELPFIHDLAANARQLIGSGSDFPECLFDDSGADGPAPLQVLRQRYLARLRLTSILEPGVRKFTDKMPMNELHLGLIRGLFPEAKIVHVVRHPLDSVLSTFFTDASHGGNCSYSLQSTAEHYRLLFEMTEFYRRKLHIKLLRVRYEDIVRNIRKQTETMLGFLDEELEQACLEFHLNPRYARTASYAQVTEELYDTSLYRYRNYLKHLEPVLPILEPAIERLGYDV